MATEKVLQLAKQAIKNHRPYSPQEREELNELRIQLGLKPLSSAAEISKLVETASKSLAPSKPEMLALLEQWLALAKQDKMDKTELEYVKGLEMALSAVQESPTLEAATLMMRQIEAQAASDRDFVDAVSEPSRNSAGMTGEQTAESNRPKLSPEQLSQLQAKKDDLLKRHAAEKQAKPKIELKLNLKGHSSLISRPLRLDSQLTDAQREILRSLLKTTRRVPPQYRLEEIQMGPATHYELYRQEGDKEGMALYKPLLDLVNKAKSVEELEALA